MQQPAVTGDRLPGIAAALQQGSQAVAVQWLVRVGFYQTPQVLLRSIRTSTLKADHHQVFQGIAIVRITRKD